MCLKLVEQQAAVDVGLYAISSGTGRHAGYGFLAEFPGAAVIYVW